MILWITIIIILTICRQNCNRAFHSRQGRRSCQSHALSLLLVFALFILLNFVITIPQSLFFFQYHFHNIHCALLLAFTFLHSKSFTQIKMSTSNYSSTGVPFIHFTSTFPPIYWLLLLAAIFILTLGVAIFLRLRTARRRRGDEEALPLLVDNEQGRGYDTIPDAPATTNGQTPSPRDMEARIQFIDIIKARRSFYLDIRS